MSQVIKKLSHYINGKWVSPNSSSSPYFPVYNPANQQVIAHAANGNAHDVDAAVKAARHAFDHTNWSQTTGAQRAIILRAIADKISQNLETLSFIETQDCGKAFKEAEMDMNDVIACFQYFAKRAEELDEKQDQKIVLSDSNFTCRLRYEPVGVVAAIIPWNYPLLMLAWKVAPLLAAGCTTVVKPSELTPLTALEFASLSAQAGLPAGVLNIVTGAGETGALLSKHKHIDKVCFTGSVPTGIAVASAAVNNITRVTLELGGKSPIVVFNDADIPKAVEWVMFGVFFSNGQVCSATSRLLIHEDIADQFIAHLVKATQLIPILDPNSAEARNVTGMLGPLVSSRQRDRVLSFIDTAVKEGAQVLCGGGIPPQHKTGYFVQPTILKVQPHHQIWTEEVFGPVLTLMTFRTEEEALRIANDTEYGLAGAVISADTARCERFARRLRVGIVWINCSQPCFCDAPWGGMKKSGFGRELGPDGLNIYLETKQITTKANTDALGWFNMPKSKL